jgi:carboxymethylenebutenolidase
MVSTQWISIPNGTGSQTDAYLALPPGGRGPALLLFQEIFGVNAHIRAVAEQYAQAGYVVLAPDLFWAQARRVELAYAGDDLAKAYALMEGCVQEQLLSDIQAYAQALRARPELSGAHLGAVGYCMGGRMAYFAATHARADAAVCFYGGRIQNCLEFAHRVSGALQFHYGTRDSMIPMSAVEAVRAAHPTDDIKMFDADHGFNCWARGTFEAEAARQSFALSLSFLAKHLP